MKKAKFLLIGLGAYFAFRFINKKSAAEKLNYFVQKVSVSFSGFTPVLNIVLGIQNPTNETINLGSIVGELYVNNNYVANIYGYQYTQIKGLANTFYPIAARLSLSGLIGEGADIVKAISTGDVNTLINQTIKFVGNVNAEGVTMPLTFTYKVL